MSGYLCWSSLEDTAPSQSIFEPLFPSTSSKFFPTFLSKTLLDAPPVHVVKQHAPPSPLTTPGLSNIQPMTTKILPDNTASNSYPYDVWIMYGEHNTPVPITELPSSTQYITSKSATIQPAQLPPLVTALPLDPIKIPQRNCDQGQHKQWNFKQLNPIPFNMNGCPGINLGDALCKKFTDLNDWDNPMLQDATGAISRRFLVGFLWEFSTRVTELTPSQVPQVSR